MKRTPEQKQQRKQLTETLRKVHPEWRGKRALKESRKLIREASEDLTALDSTKLAARLLRVWSQ